MEATNKIKPIETVYNGYRFRSRLEARWAVFFDNAKIKYQYEAEGFEAKDGTRYLPDFYLPDLDAYVEVKADTPKSIDDINRCLSMIEWGGPIKGIVFLSDIPVGCTDGGMWHFPAVYWSDISIVSGWWFFCDNDDENYSCRGQVSSADYKSPFLIRDSRLYFFDSKEKENFKLSPVSDTELLKSSKKFIKVYHETTLEQDIEIQLWGNKRTFYSFKKAKQARFEYGEKG